MIGWRIALAISLHVLWGCDGRKVPEEHAGTMLPPAYWVWHRGSELNDAEVGVLHGTGIGKLYWQAAECRWEDGRWAFKRIAKPMAGAPGIRIVPVFRIEPQTAFLGTPDAAGRFAETIRRWLGEAAMPDEIQLDFDCPDRLMDRYARFLTDMGKEVAPAEISITALASWPRHPDFRKLAAAVDSFAPMFYDLEEDKPSDVRAGRFQSLADPAVKQHIARWSKCTKPWLAGLPNFERLSVFANDGVLIGHVRDWRDDALFFHPQLKRRDVLPGTAVFDPLEVFDLSGTRVAPGMGVVHRTPDAVELGRLVEAARDAGAAGIIWFALPGPGMRSAFSVPHLTHPHAGLNLELRVAGDGSVVLENPGPADLPPGAWELRIRGGEPGSFRSASPGAFAELAQPDGLPAEMADSLVLRFARLPAGGSIVSGPLVTKNEGLVWRIDGATQEKPVASWKSAR